MKPCFEPEPLKMSLYSLYNKTKLKTDFLVSRSLLPFFFSCSLGNGSKEVAPVCSALVTLFSRNDPVQKIELALKNYTLSKVFVLWHHWHVFGFWEEGRRKKLKVEGLCSKPAHRHCLCVCLSLCAALSGRRSVSEKCHAWDLSTETEWGGQCDVWDHLWVSTVALLQSVL